MVEPVETRVGFGGRACRDPGGIGSAAVASTDQSSRRAWSPTSRSHAVRRILPGSVAAWHGPTSSGAAMAPTTSEAPLTSLLASSNISRARERPTRLVDVRSSWCGVRSLTGGTRRTHSRSKFRGGGGQNVKLSSKGATTTYVLWLGLPRAARPLPRPNEPPRAVGLRGYQGLDKLEHRTPPARSRQARPPNSPSRSRQARPPSSGTEPPREPWRCRKFTDTTGEVHEAGAPDSLLCRADSQPLTTSQRSRQGRRLRKV